MFETEFTPIASLGGGLLIGLAAVMLMALHGRIAGLTGILSGVLFPQDRADWVWRVAFIAGMASAPLLIMFATGSMPTVEFPVGLEQMLVGGVIVGLGAAIGQGCTSGHGVCGMSRLSVRSIAATLTFMATTAGTVFLLRHVIGG